MVRKIKAKAILRLNDQGLSGRAIARSLGIARQSVAEVLAASAAAGIAYPDVETKPDDEVYSMLFPGRGERESVYEQPDWARVHRELARVGVTLRILHGEYADECAAAGRPRMGYDRFCKQYAAYVARTGVTSRVEHKAGRTIEVDWAGKTMRIVDPVTGDVSKAYLFVAVLPFSRYAFVEPTLDMGQNAWLRCHVAMYEWFGGSTPRLVCDNLKTGVISHPRDGEVVLNDAYRSMAEHYSAAVIPGRVRRPKDKPSAENTVWHATMALAGAMRDRAFASLDELRGAVRGWLDEYNSRPFQKRDGSRRSVFESDERPLLIPLPGTAYEVADWIYGRGRCSPTATSRMRATGIPSRTPTPEPSWTCASAPTRSRCGTRAPGSARTDSCPPRRPTDTARTRPTCPGRPDGGNGTGNAASDGRNASDRTARTSSGGCSPRGASTTRGWSPRWRCCGSRDAIPSGVSRTRARWPCSRSPRQGTRTSGRYSRPART